jgi:prepilin-type processing-associated H-X9-DG protein
VSGGINNPGAPNGPTKQGLGWAYQILPYLEQNAVHGLVSTDQIKQTVIPFYACPSRRTAQTMETVASIGSGVVAIMDYASAQPLTTVCGGTGEKHNIVDTHPFQGATSNNVAEDAFWCTAPARTPSTNDSVFDGVIVRILWKRLLAATANSAARGKFLSGGIRSVKPAQVTDGMSNTFMISEKFVRSDMIDSNIGPNGQISYSDDSGWTDGWDPDTVRFTGYQPISDNTKGFCYEPSTAKYCTGENADVYFFGSSHPSGINSAFADGSVHHITFDVDILLFNALGTRNGEEVVDTSQL